MVISIPVVFAESSNIGTIYWKQEIISSNSFVDIYVHDDDMNKKAYPNFADKFTIDVWSDSSPDGLEIQVVETGVYSGIFKGSVLNRDIELITGQVDLMVIVRNLQIKLIFTF